MMTVYYFTFRSMTGAMSSAMKLRKQGLRVMPIRSPEALRKQGCGYCIAMEEEQYHRSRGSLRPGEYEKLYENRDGHWKELRE